jgi:carbon monoxide dehydrogenase subunit G
MKIEGEYIFDGPREAVWKLVRDPEVLMKCMPGTQTVNKISDMEFTGEVTVRIGPFSGSFAGRVIVSDEIPPQSCTLTVEGTGKLGFLKGVGSIDMTELEGGKTLMKYSGEAQIGGKVASVGQRLFDSVSKSMAKQGLDTLNEILKSNNA